MVESWDECLAVLMAECSAGQMVALTAASLDDLKVASMVAMSAVLMADYLAASKAASMSGRTAEQ